MMHFDHIHFYVTNAKASRDWFIEKLGFKSLGCVTNRDTHTEIIQQGTVDFLLSSPVTAASPVARYLHHHPPGVVDVAFQIENLEIVAESLVAEGAKILQPIQEYFNDHYGLKWLIIAGWGDLHHTLVERHNPPSWKWLPQVPFPISLASIPSSIIAIDHVVLNVEAGDLQKAVSWYQRVLKFLPQQAFDIQTKRSGLHSQVLVNPQKNVKFPINEPTSNNSQIQEFLDVNRGSGIQHIALKTNNLIETVGQLRQKGLPFISVSPDYYTQLQPKLNPDLSPEDWEKIQAYKILIDFPHPESMLWQIFTQPIFAEPTFFFEFIERKITWINHSKIEAEGFGEGNFQALFEAIEQEQIKRNR